MARAHDHHDFILALKQTANVESSERLADDIVAEGISGYCLLGSLDVSAQDFLSLLRTTAMACQGLEDAWRRHLLRD